LSAASSGSIATIGARPTRPETGYGYLRIGELVADGAHRVRAFVEKPTREQALQYLQDGGYLWNCGMFFFRAEAILREISLHLPELHAFVLRADEAALQGHEPALVATEYAKLPKISIDYGIMEKASDVLVVPADFGWDDVGSWAAGYELAAKDAARNAAQGDLLALDAQGCYVSVGSDKLVVLLGVQDLVVVDTPDALLVMPRERAQDVSKVVEALKRTGRERHV
jgi:mannose-1-phosphate guanylyltransferase